MPDVTTWTQDEEVVFKKLNVAENNLTLRMLIRGQRNINGRIFAALTDLLNCFPKAGLSAECVKALEEAQDIVAKIPGEDPPFCSEVIRHK